MMIGITGYTTRHHIARATLEATCFQTKAILDSMMLDSKGDLKVLKVDGGMTDRFVFLIIVANVCSFFLTSLRSDVAMQLQADILGIGVERPEMRE
jgi:glycerol kinase